MKVLAMLGTACCQKILTLITTTSSCYYSEETDSAKPKESDEQINN